MSRVPKYIQTGITGKKTATAVSLGCNMIRTFDVSSMWWTASLCTGNHPPLRPYNNKNFVSAQGVYFS